MKKIPVLVLIFLLLFSTAVESAPVVEKTEEMTLVKGVTYKNIKGLYESGWQDIHIVTADLTQKHLSLEILKNINGQSYLETTLDAAKKNNTVAAINGDFFAAKRGESGRGSAVGVEIRDGKLYSSASVEEDMNTLYKLIGENGFNVDSFLFDITLTAANGMQDKIKLINKYDDLTGIVMYTSDWNDKSLGSTGGVIEISVDKNGVVIDKRTEAEPIDIPDGGYVLSSHMSYNTFLLDYVNIGDKVFVDIKSTPDFSKIETAVGGGGVLVRDGVAQTEFSHNVSGKNPRTAIGLDKSGTKVTLLVLDGRRSDARGMTQQELGKLMEELGCYTALNFDGGGSSLMAIEQRGEQTTVNKPSDGGNRKVTNSLGIVSSLKENAPIKEIKIKTQENVFSGYKTSLLVYGIDEYLREVDIDKKVIYKTDNGTIKDGILIPEKAGIAQITAYCMGKTVKKTVTVLDKPNEMSFSQEKVLISSGKTYTPYLIAKDKDGKISNIDLSDVDLTASSDCVSISDGKINAIKKGASHITAKTGEITANMRVLVDDADDIGKIENIKKQDIKNTANELKDGGYRFSVFGNTKNPETMFNKFVMNRATIKMKNASGFQVFLGADVNIDTLTHVKDTYKLAKEYSCFNVNGDTFITLPNVDGRIYTGDISVWTKFKNDVSASGKNLFIFIDRNFISDNETEIYEFKKILEEQAKSKNVYVFGGGFENNNTIENSVRYVNTAGFFPSVSLEGTSVEYVKYVLVTVNGDDVTYEYKQAVIE